MTSPFSLQTFYQNEKLRIIPITELKIADIERFGTLDHGFEDIPFFPSWKEFYLRSIGKVSKYPDYMAFVLIINEETPPIGVLAVQVMDYEQIKTKVIVALPKIEKYLYLSWIALDKQYHSLNYFAVLFDFYQSLIRKLRKQYQTRMEGAAIAIRRMRPVLWRFLNCDMECPTTIEDIFMQETKKFSFTFKPSEIFNPAILPVQDHVLMIFKTRQ